MHRSLCMLEYRAFTKHLLTRVSIVIYIFCKLTIYKYFHSYWFVVQCCEIRCTVRKMPCKNFPVFCFCCSFSAITSAVMCICTCLHVWICRCVLYIGSNFSHSFIWNRFITQNSFEFVVYALNALRKPPLANFPFTILGPF